MQPSKTPVLDVATKAAKCGVAVQRFKIDRCQAEHIKTLEKSDPSAALAQLLRYLCIGIKA